jgi:hypothetical protein
MFLVVSLTTATNHTYVLFQLLIQRKQLKHVQMQKLFGSKVIELLIEMGLGIIKSDSFR